MVTFVASYAFFFFAFAHRARRGEALQLIGYDGGSPVLNVERLSSPRHVAEQRLIESLATQAGLCGVALASISPR